MHDMAVALDRHELIDFFRAEADDPADVVTGQVHQHDVLGQLLGVLGQLALQEAIENRAAAFGISVDSRIERGRDYRHAMRQTIDHERYDRIVIAAAAHASPGFSPDDVAWLLDARLDAFETTGEDRWLEGAREIAGYLLSHYWDGEVPTSGSPHVGAGLFSSSDLVADLRIRPKEIFDGATPSSHAVACRALARLALCDADAGMLCVAQRLVELASAMIATHPSAVPDLVSAAGFALEGVEIVVPGEPNELSDHVRLMPMSDSVLITGSGSSPLLGEREAGLAYVCRAGACGLATRSLDELDEQLARARR